MSSIRSRLLVSRVPSVLFVDNNMYGGCCMHFLLSHLPTGIMDIHFRSRNLSQCRDMGAFFLKTLQCFFNALYFILSMQYLCSFLHGFLSGSSSPSLPPSWFSDTARMCSSNAMHRMAGCVSYPGWCPSCMRLIVYDTLEGVQE